MDNAEYTRILENSVATLDQLEREKDRVELELSKIRQFIQATLAMFDRSPSGRLGARLAQMEADLERESSSYGLSEAIRETLKAASPRFFSVANMRDALMKGGFDFSSYTSNPLAAVGTTLRRLSKNNDAIEVSEIDGVGAFRWKSERTERGAKGTAKKPTAQYGHCIFTRFGSDERKELIRKAAEATGASMADYSAHFAAEAARTGMPLPADDAARDGKATEYGSRVLTAFENKSVKQLVVEAAEAVQVSASAYIARFALEAAKAGKKLPAKKAKRKIRLITLAS